MELTPSDWTPLCIGTLRDDIWATVLDIAEGLRSVSFTDPSLTGAAGTAVFYCYLSRALGTHDFDPVIDSLFETATGQVERLPLTEALYGGFTGFAWSLEHVFPSNNDDDPNGDIDQALLAMLERHPWSGHYDLVGGLVGIGVYALERCPRASAVKCLNSVIDRLGELSCARADGFTWWTDPRYIGVRKKQYPDGYYSLGLAHGVPGVIAMLGRACALPETTSRARSLFEGATSWLLNQRLPLGSASRFPGVEGSSVPTRAAWCWGDAGVASALLLAARSVGDERLERAAIEVALEAAARLSASSDVFDVGLCHGSAGLAHLFNRLYQATGEAKLADAALSWFARTLDFRQPGRGIAGFDPLTPRADGGATPDASFLTGVTGIALSLLASVTTVEPKWDRVLMCSIAPKQQAIIVG